MTIGIRVRLLSVATVSLIASGRVSTQAPSAADGPWAGWAQCQLTAQFNNAGQTYLHQQIHTWVLTGATPLPTSTAAIKQFAATWQVTGQGTRQRGQGGGPGNNEQWTTAGQPMPDTLTIRQTAEGNVRIGGAAQLRSVGTTTGTVLPYVDEWTFPVIEGPATQTSISGGPVPQGLAVNFPGAPPGTTSTVTCSWNFVRGGGVPQPPPGAAAAGPSPTTPPLIPAPLATATAGPAPTTPPLIPVPLATATAEPAPGTTDNTLSLGTKGTALDNIGLAPPRLTADPGPCKLAGPVVFADATVATPGAVQMAWRRDPWVGVTSLRPPTGVTTNVEYSVTRADLGGTQMGAGLASSPSTGSSLPFPIPGENVAFVHAAKLEEGKTYVYKIRARHFHQDVRMIAAGSAATNYFPVWQATANYEDGCGETAVTITAPQIQTPVLTNLGNAKGSVTIDWKMPSDQRQTGFLVLGAGLPSNGTTVGQTHIQINELPAGSQSWLIAPYWDTPSGRAINASTGLRVTATLAPWTSTPGPPPTGILVQAFPSSDPIANSCSVRININWAPVPGTTGYTVYNDNAAISARIPLTNFSFSYKEGALRLSDLARGVLLQGITAIGGSDYVNGPLFKRGVNIKVVAAFTDRPDGVSGVVPYSFSTYPCWDGLGDR